MDPLNPTSFYINISQSPESLVLSDQDWEKSINEFGNYCNMVTFAHSSSKDSRELCNSAKDMQAHMNAMKQHGASKKELYEFAKNSLPILQGLKERLSSIITDFPQQQMARQTRSRLLLDKINSTQFTPSSLDTAQNFSNDPYAPKKLLSESFITEFQNQFSEKSKSSDSTNQPYDGLASQSQLNLREHVAGMRMIAAGLNAIGDAVVGAAKFMCNTTDESKKRCKLVLGQATIAGKDFLEFTHLDKALKYLQSCDGSSVAKAMVDCGIPQAEAEELSKQYVSDLQTVGMGGLTVGASIGIKHLAGKIATLSAREAALNSAPKVAKHAVEVLVPGDKLYSAADGLIPINAPNMTTKMLPTGQSKLSSGNVSYAAENAPKLPLAENSNLSSATKAASTNLPASQISLLPRPNSIIEATDSKHSLAKRNFVLLEDSVSIIKSKKVAGGTDDSFFYGVSSFMNNGETFGYLSGIVNEGIYGTKGLTSQAINQFKSQAIENSSKKLILEVEFANRKLFRVMLKTYPYLGNAVKNHLGDTIELPIYNSTYEHLGYLAAKVHRFEIPLDNPNGSLMSDRLLRKDFKIIPKEKVNREMLALPRPMVEVPEIIYQSAGEIQGALNRIYKSLDYKSGKSIQDNILQSLHEIDAILPSKTTLPKWLVDVLEPTYGSVTTIDLEYIQQGSLSTIAKIRAGSKEFIFKQADDFEILFEAVGLDKFRSLNLKHMALPEMVALGNTSINAYIVRTYL
ncbi:MAG: hypothetical protein H0W50_07675, partial [Parachlamydiaceae bacterium]|nr:hypothetical protein [Parachlamydiaceae bacterium]